MKKIIFAAVLLICLGLNAQTKTQRFSKNAIGLRLSDDGSFGNDGIWVEASYQRKVLTMNRIEVDLGIRNNDHYNDGYYYDNGVVKLTGLFQWVWHIDRGLNWYAGVGAGFGSYRNHARNNLPDNGGFGFVAGNIGIEYDFDFPLQVFTDFRPEVGFGD